MADTERLTLAASLRSRDYATFSMLLYIYFAYWLGIIQDFYYGAKYLLALINTQQVSGSFPFMFGWTAVMLWGVRKPIERRVVLFLTGLLVAFKFAESMILISASKFEGNPYIPLLGAILWFSSCMLAGRLPRSYTRRKNAR